MTLQYKVVQKSSGTLIAACQRADDAVRVAEAYVDRDCVVKWAGRIVWRSGELMASIVAGGITVHARVTEINRQAYDKQYGPGAYDRMLERLDNERELAAENAAAAASALVKS